MARFDSLQFHVLHGFKDFSCSFVYVDGKEKQIETASLTNECPIVGI